MTPNPDAAPTAAPARGAAAADQPHAHAYRGVMDRVTALVADLDPAAAATIVPATPAWQVRELLAHLAGTPADVIEGRLPGADFDTWTAAQVEARRGRSVTELLEEWQASWPAFAPLLTALAEAHPTRATIVVYDALSHEQDLRSALDRPGAREVEDWSLAWDLVVRLVGRRRDEQQAGALVLEPDDRAPTVAGSGEVTTTVRAPAFEILRAVTGRRSVAQMQVWDWHGPWSPEQLCLFPPRDTDLVE